jgi:hypothetical protein
VPQRPVSCEEAVDLLDKEPVMNPGQFYAHQCPETKRWFVCQDGVDNNLCECFAWNGRSAQDIAGMITAFVNGSGFGRNYYDTRKYKDTLPCDGSQS